jgi:hypothetical protein
MRFVCNSRFCCWWRVLAVMGQEVVGTNRLSVALLAHVGVVWRVPCQCEDPLEGLIGEGILWLQVGC